MRETITFRVEGLTALDRQLHSLPVSVAGRALTASVRAGARIVKEAVRDKAPVHTGALRDNLYLANERTGSDAEKTVLVGIRNRKTYYWRFVEFGTRKMAARPFLRPAFDGCEHEAVDAITDKLDQRITTALALYR